MSVLIDAPEQSSSDAVMALGTDGRVAWMPSIVLPSLAALTAYAGAATSVAINGSSFTYASGSSATVDGVLVLSATGKGVGQWLRDLSMGINIAWYNVDQTGVADATAAIQSAVSNGGLINLVGTLKVTSNITLPSNVVVQGEATLVVGSAVTQVFSAIGKSNVRVVGLTAVRAAGNTGDPILLHVQQCTTVRYLRNITTGVLGLQCYRPAYSGATTASLCYDVEASFNQITTVGGGPYGGAITLQYVDRATAIGNTINGALHGIQWWGGDGNPINGENNTAGTNSKWAKNLTIGNNTVKNISGGGIWGSMGENIAIVANTVAECGDVGIDPEASINVTATANVVTNCTNAALSVFYGSRYIDFIGNEVTQGSAYGNGFHAYGTLLSSNVKIMGGSITTLSTTADTIFTEDGVLNDFVLGGGLIINSAYRAFKLQKANNVTLSAPLTVRCAVTNVDGGGGNGARPYAMYVQGGDNLIITPGVSFVFTGTGNAGAILLSDGGSGNQSNAKIDSVRAPGFTLGIKNDQFIGGSGNRLINNQVEALSITNGAVYANNNRSTAGAYVDSTVDISRAVQGPFASSRTAVMANANNDSPAGFYNVNDAAGAYFPLLGGDPARVWHVLNMRNEDGSGTSGQWQFQLASNLWLGNVYLRSRFADGRGWVTTPLNAPINPVAGDISYYDGTSWVRLAKGTTGQTLQQGASAPAWVTVANTILTAGDGNYVISGPGVTLKLPLISANRVVTLPTAATYPGRTLKIWNQNTSGTATWSFSGTVKDAANNTITNLTNSVWYVLESDGTNWNKIL